MSFLLGEEHGRCQPKTGATARSAVAPEPFLASGATGACAFRYGL